TGIQRLQTESRVTAATAMHGIFMQLGMDRTIGLTRNGSISPLDAAKVVGELHRSTMIGNEVPPPPRTSSGSGARSLPTLPPIPSAKKVPPLPKTPNGVPRLGEPAPVVRG